MQHCKLMIHILEVVTFLDESSLESSRFLQSVRHQCILLETSHFHKLNLLLLDYLAYTVLLPERSL